MKVESTLFRVEFKQRNHDGKWVKFGQVVDFDNIYNYKDNYGRTMQVIPMMWIILNVYDYELEFVD